VSAVSRSRAVELVRPRAASTARVRAIRERRRVARAIIRAAREMHRLDLVVGTVGNVSARTPSGFAITPSARPYDDVAPRDLVLLDADGAVLAGRLAPSREWRMHAGIYRARPDVRAVVHTHSLHATAWSFLEGEELPVIEEIGYYGLGRVAVSAAATAGEDALARNAVQALGGAGAVLLGRHGVTAVGATVDEALVRASVIERQAAVACLLRTSGAGHRS
jgi:L-fuculose-phosphate aldolase